MKNGVSESLRTIIETVENLTTPFDKACRVVLETSLEHFRKVLTQIWNAIT